MEFGLDGLKGQNHDVSLEAILAKVSIKSENMIECMIIDQSKAGAIDEAEILVMVAHENRLGRLFIRFADTKRFDSRPVKPSHEFDSRRVTDPEPNKGVGLGENKVGGQ